MKKSPGHQLQSLRQRVWHICEGPDCDKRFLGLRTARYCSNRCRQRAKRERQKQEAPE